MTGQYTFQDLNHDGVISYNPGGQGDDTRVLNLTPRFLGGIGMDFNYGAVRLSLFFNVKDKLGKKAIESSFPGAVNRNQPSAIVGKEWQRPGDIATFSRFTTGSQISDVYFFTYSDGVYTDASFIRLSNLAFSYDLPTNFSKKIGLKTCSVFFHTNNLFVITKYKGVDPETQNFGGLPPVKTIVGGINIDF